MKSTGLGKGLSALIDDTEIVEQEGATVEIDINKIDICKDQPRKHFDEDKLKELADSVKQHGIIQPLVLNKNGSRYMIVAGERRFRAARMAGLKYVPAVIREFDKKEILEISIIENIQREDLNPIEEANAIMSLMNDYGLTQERVAERIDRSRSTIANTLRLLTLPKNVAAMVATGELSQGHARTLLPLKDEKKMEQAAKEVVQKRMSVRETEQMVKKLNAAPQKKQKEQKRNPDVAAAEKEMGDALGTKVTIQGSDKKGKLVIEYYSREQLDAVYNILMQQEQE